MNDSLLCIEKISPREHLSFEGSKLIKSVI